MVFILLTQFNEIFELQARVFAENMDFIVTA
jgi:hypothetical protein